MQTLGIYHEVCALLVSAEKWVWFPCNSIPMPPAGYMLEHEIRKSLDIESLDGCCFSLCPYILLCVLHLFQLQL